MDALTQALPTEEPSDRALLPARVYYFLYYAAWAFLAPFLALYYKSLGFSGTQIGLLASITPLTTLFAAPFWGGIADASRRHKRVLLVAMAGAGAAVLGLSQARSFWLLAPLVALYAFFTATIMPLVDNSVIALLGERRDRYGHQRLWGAVGWGLAGPAAGWLTGHFDLSWAFIGYLSLLSLALIVALRMPVIGAGQSTRFWSGIRVLLADRRWYIFLVTVFISGAGLAVISNFLFLYMADLHATRTVMGLALTMATVSEVIVLFFSGKMLRRWGPRGLLLFSLGAYVMRAFLYTAATAPWQVLLIQLFHGLTFSTMLVAGVNFASVIAPRGLGATAQGLFAATMSGFGGITGSLVGGLLLDRFGGSGMFFWSGCAVLVGLLAFLLMSRRMQPAPQQT